MICCIQMASLSQYSFTSGLSDEHGMLFSMHCLVLNLGLVYACIEMVSQRSVLCFEWLCTRVHPFSAPPGVDFQFNLLGATSVFVCFCLPLPMLMCLFLFVSVSHY
jgi:hypothetical protein